MTWARHQLIDFTVTMRTSETFIISKKGVSSFAGNLIRDVYDYESYALFLIAFVLLTCAAGFVSKKRHFTEVLLSTLGSLLGQTVKILENSKGLQGVSSY